MVFSSQGKAFFEKTQQQDVKIFKTKMVINCAGAYTDKIAGMGGVDDFSIIPKRGEYILMHKNQGRLFKHILFQAPTEKGRGYCRRDF